MTIQGLINKIFKANQTQNNTVSWTGVNGLKSIQEDIVQTIRERTFFTVPTTSDLVNQGFNNAILCYVQDHAFFRWQAQGIPNGTTIFPANDGGVWVQETIGDTDGTVTSIGLSMPAAFTVANSPVTTSGVIGVTANGTSAQYIKGDGTLGTLPTPTGGTVTNVSALTLNTSGTDLSSTVANPTTTPVITLSVPTASAVNRGVLSPTDWTTFNSKQNALTLTTTGTSGAATLVGSTLNIPQYQSVITNPVTGTGTLNYHSKWTSSSTLGNSLIYDDGTNVGVGTISPTTKLDVAGTVQSSGDFLFNAYNRSFASTSYPALYLYSSNVKSIQNIYSAGSTNGLSFYNNGSTLQMRIFDNGNVTINSATDAGYKLDVLGTTRIQNTLSVSNPSYSGGGSFFQSANFTTVISGGPAGENVTFGPSNRIFLNASQVRVQTGSLQIASTLSVGTTNATAINMIWANGSITAGSNIARGIFTDTTLVASANNDVLVGLDVAPTFTNGAFTGVQNYAARISGALAGVTKYMSTGTGATSHYLEIISTSSTNTYVNLVRNGGANGTYAYYLNAGAAYLSVDNGSGETRLYANGGGYYLTFFSNGVEAMRIATTRNVLIGTTTDAGYKLDVNGTARVQNTLYTQPSITISSTNGYFLGNSGGNITNTLGIITFQHPTNFTSGTAFAFSDSLNNGAISDMYGNKTAVLIKAGFKSPNSTWTFNNLEITSGYVNGGMNVTARGIYYNPDVSSLTGTYTHRAIETVTGDVYFASTSGNVGIGLAPSSSYKIQISGTGYISSALYFGGNQDYINPSSNNGVFEMASNLPIVFKNKTGTEFARFATTGNFLIGTTTDSGYKLDVAGTARVQSSITWGSTGGGRLTFSGSDAYIDAALSGGSLYFRTNGSTNTMLLSSASNVLVGTTTDAGYKLDVNGTARIGSTSNNVLFSTSATANFIQQSFNATYFIYAFVANNSYGITNSRETYVLQVGGSTKGFRFESNTGAATMFVNTVSGSSADQYVNIGGNRNSQNSPSAILELESNIKGFLKPRMTTTQRNAIATPATGLEVYNTTTNTEDYYNGTTWVSLQTSAAAVKSFGSWQHNVTQTAAANNTGYGVKFATGDITGQGVDVINDLSGNPTLIKMNNTGYYNIQFSFQFQNTDTGDQDVTIWLRKNGETTPFDVSSSAGFISVPSSHGGTPGHCIAAWNYFVQANAGDYFQLVWSTTLASRVEMEYYAAGSPPPSAASAILTVNQVN